MNYLKARRSKQARLTLKRKLVDLMGGQCVDCGYSSHLAALDFDHKNPKEKSFSLAYGLCRLTELDCEVEAFKCEVRCANCHRVKTHPQANK